MCGTRLSVIIWPRLVVSFVIMLVHMPMIVF